jgi:uncharacterized protein (TIGR03067 family)
MSTHAPISPSLVGKWEPIRGELEGEPVPELVIRQTSLKLSATDYDVYFDGQLADHGHYLLTAAEPHPMLTLHGKEGTNAGRTILAIYQLAGDRLRICYGLAGIPPTTFATSVNSRRYLVSYRRIQ